MKEIASRGEEALRVVERSYCYKLLSTIFSTKEPGNVLNNLASLIKRSVGSFSPEAERLLRLAEKISSLGWTEKIEGVMGEMKKLEPLERKLVPGASVGVVLSDIAGFYKAFGLSPSEELPIDHLSVESEFMAQLLLREAYALTNDNEEMREIVVDAERKFLRDHLGRTVYYIKAFRDAAPMFDELLQALEVFIDSEFARLGIQRIGTDPMEIQEAPTDAVRCPFS